MEKLSSTLLHLGPRSYGLFCSAFQFCIHNCSKGTYCKKKWRFETNIMWFQRSHFFIYLPFIKEILVVT